MAGTWRSDVAQLSSVSGEGHIQQEDAQLADIHLLPCNAALLVDSTPNPRLPDLPTHQISGTLAVEKAQNLMVDLEIMHLEQTGLELRKTACPSKT